MIKLCKLVLPVESSLLDRAIDNTKHVDKI